MFVMHANMVIKDLIVKFVMLAIMEILILKVDIADSAIAIHMVLFQPTVIMLQANANAVMGLRAEIAQPAAHDMRSSTVCAHLATKGAPRNSWKLKTSLKQSSNPSKTSPISNPFRTNA
jgi:hypothetical protein